MDLSHEDKFENEDQFQSSLLTPTIIIPASEPSHHQKNPLKNTSYFQSFPLSKTIMESNNNTFNRTFMPTDSILDNDRLKQKGDPFFKHHLIQIFGTDSILDEGEFNKIIKQYYLQNQIAFIAVTGTSNSGKSLFCDTVLNSVGVMGNHYFRTKKFGNFLWSTPFKKGNMVIFLIQINFDSFKAQEQYIQSIKKLSKIVGTWIVMDLKALIQLDNIFEYILRKKENYQQIDIKQVYLLTKQKLSQFKLSYLPNPHIYELSSATTSFMSALQKQSLHQLPSLAYNPSYVSQVQKIFAKIYMECEQHQMCNKVSLTGDLLSKIYKPIEEESIEQIKEAVKQQIDKKYDGYQKSAFENYKIESNLQLGPENPAKEVSQLESKLQQISQKAFIRYGEKDKNFMDMNTRQKYYTKLENEIETEQNRFIQQNKLKTAKQLQEWYEEFMNEPKTQEQILQALRKEKVHLNHGRQLFISKKIEDLLQRQPKQKQSKASSVNKNDLSSSQQDLQRIKQLKASITATEMQLDKYHSIQKKISGKSDDEEAKQLLKQNQLERKQELQKKLKKFKEELSEIKNRQSQNQKIKEIKNEKSLLIERQRQIEQKLDQLKRFQGTKKQKKRNFCGIRF